MMIDMLYKTLISEKGFALPLALIVMLVGALLGTALWQYSVTDTMHVAMDKKRMQAYYIARSGAEAALQAWLESPLESKPIGASNTVYLNKATGEFVNTIPTQSAGKYDVTIEEVNSSTTKIISIGQVEDITQKATVTISGNYKYGHELGWYKYESGQIYDGTHPSYDGTVLIDPKGWKIKEPSSTLNPTFECTTMFFFSSIGNPFNKTLNLVAETIVFTPGSDIELKKKDGQLILFVPDGKGIVREGKPGVWGIVFFQDVYDGNTLLSNLSRKAFYFPNDTNGINITVLSDFNKMEIVEGITPPLPEMLNYSIIWSY